MAYTLRCDGKSNSLCSKIMKLEMFAKCKIVTKRENKTIIIIILLLLTCLNNIDQNILFLSFFHFLQCKNLG